MKKTAGTSVKSIYQKKIEALQAIAHFKMNCTDVKEEMEIRLLMMLLVLQA